MSGGDWLNPEQIKKFWLKVDVGHSDTCWNWKASRNRSNGYGQVVIGYQHAYAHRVAYEIKHGYIPEGLFVCHTCDNPICCNPDHLFLGTNKDNVNDAMRKGRMGKLTQEQIDRIRHLRIEEQFSLRQLGQEFNVSISTISLIVNNKRWGERRD